MAHYLDGKCFRYTFLVDKESLTDALAKELADYLKSIQNEEDELSEKGVTTGGNVYYYDTTIFLKGDQTLVIPVIAVIFYGADWGNFIESLLQFHNTFFSHGKAQRETDYAFSLKDEGRRFDDFK